VTVDWSLLVILSFPPLYTIAIYWYATKKYGVVDEAD